MVTVPAAPRSVDPLVSTAAIVDREGFPTPYFIRQWLAQKEVNITVDDVTVSLTDLSDDVTTLIARKIIAGVGLDGGGDLSKIGRAHV